MERLADEFHGQNVRFLVIYTREAHPGQFRFKDIQQTRTLEDRRCLATRLSDEGNLKRRTILIDEPDDRVTRAYRGFPNKIYVVGLDGRIAYAHRWADARGLDKWLRGKVINPFLA